MWTTFYQLKADEIKEISCFSGQDALSYVLGDLGSSLKKMFQVKVTRWPNASTWVTMHMDRCSLRGRTQWDRNYSQVLAWWSFPMVSYWRKQHVNSCDLRWPLQIVSLQNLLGSHHICPKKARTRENWTVLMHVQWIWMIWNISPFPTYLLPQKKRFFLM